MSARWSWIAGIALLAILSIGGLVYLWSWLPDELSTSSKISYVWCWLSGDDSPSATIRNLVLALAALVALPFAIWRSYTAYKQADAAQNQAAAAQEQLTLAELDSLDSRYQKGSDMLGSGNISTRIGGVYTLKRLAENHPNQFHIQVMELLCAFVRNPYKTIGPLKSCDEDVRAALDAIIHRSDVGIALEASRHILSEDGSSPKIGSDQGFRVNLSGANLTRTNLDHAKLQRAILQKVDMSGVVGKHANFFGASMIGCKITEAVFNEAVFDRADMTSADMSASNFWDSSFVWTHMGKDLSKSHLEDANLTGANLVAVNLQDTKLENTDLSKARFSEGTTLISNTKKRALTSQKKFCDVTQRQLDSAMANPDDPPHFVVGTMDIETGKPIVWNHKLCGHRWLEHQKTQGSM